MANILDRLIGAFNPQAGLRRHHARELLQRAYEGASTQDGWRPRRAGASADTDHRADAATLRVRARSLVKNTPYVARGLGSMVANVIGTGINPRSLGKDAKRITALWQEWSKVADADGVRNLGGLQAAAYRAMEQDGEVLVRLRARRPSDGLPVPLQLQLLEIDWLDSAKVGSHGAYTIINPLAQWVVLNAVDDGVGTVAAHLGAVEPVDFQQLELQGHRQAIAGASGSQAHQHLAVLLHGPVRGRLQAAQIAHAIGVGDLGPLLPKGGDALGVFAQAARVDAGADDVGDHRAEAPRDVGCVLDQGAGPHAQSGGVCPVVGIGAGTGPAGSPAILCAGPFVGPLQQLTGVVAAQAGLGVEGADQAIKDVGHARSLPGSGEADTPGAGVAGRAGPGEEAGDVLAGGFQLANAAVAHLAQAVGAMDLHFQLASGDSGVDVVQVGLGVSHRG